MLGSSPESAHERTQIGDISANALKRDCNFGATLPTIDRGRLATMAFSSFRSVVAATVVFALASGSARAAPPSSDPPPSPADAHAAKAIEAFEARQYDEAIAEFTAAFSLDKNPNHLFNIGRVHEEAG